MGRISVFFQNRCTQQFAEGLGKFRYLVGLVLYPFFLSSPQVWISASLGTPLLGGRIRTQALGTTYPYPHPHHPPKTMDSPTPQTTSVSVFPSPSPVWPPALGELVWGVTRRPLGAEEAPVRRLRAPDKSGAGASSAVSMEERETEEVGGRSSRKNTATVSAASLPPCIGVKSCRCRRCSCRRCLLLLLAPGKDFPAGGTMCGVGSRSSLMWRWLNEGGTERRLSRRRKGEAKE